MRSIASGRNARRSTAMPGMERGTPVEVVEWGAGLVLGLPACPPEAGTTKGLGAGSGGSFVPAEDGAAGGARGGARGTEGAMVWEGVLAVLRAGLLVGCGPVLLL